MISETRFQAWEEYGSFLKRGSYTPAKHFILKFYFRHMRRPNSRTVSILRIYRIFLSRLKGSSSYELAKRYGLHASTIEQQLRANWWGMYCSLTHLQIERRYFLQNEGLEP